MSCNDFLGLPKNPMLPLRNEESIHCLNPFGELLFTHTWKWNQAHQPHPKSKISQQHSTPSLKKDILLCYNSVALNLYFQIFHQYRFQSLTDKQKIAVTAINNSSFTQSFLKLLQHRSTGRLFNVNSERWVEGIDTDEEDVFFEQILLHLRVGYLSEPILYLKQADIMNQRMLNWLNTVSSSRVFEYASKGKKGEENPLWFSSVSYRYLQDWFANQLEKVIIQHFLNKIVPQFIIPEFQTHLNNLGKTLESSALSLTLEQVSKYSKKEVGIFIQKLKEEEQKFFETRQHNLIISMENVEKSKKKPRRRPKKKLNKEESNKEEIKEPEEKKQQKISQIVENHVYEIENRKKQIITSHEFNKENQQHRNKKIYVEKKEKSHEIKTLKFKEKSIEKREQTPEKKHSISKNLIKVSPKRTRSPQEIRNMDMFDEISVQEKYSEQDRVSYTITEDQKSSDPRTHCEDFQIEEKQIGKRKRRKGKKEEQKFNEVKFTLYSRLVSRQMDNLVDDLGMKTNALYDHKIIAFQRVRIFVQSLFPMTNAVLFGSNAIGLSLPNSDVDILLTCLHCFSKDIASQILAQIAVQINAMGWVVSCSTYLGAKVPIVKLEIDTSIPFLNTKRKQDLFRVYNPALLYHLDHPENNIRATIKVDITINIEGITSVGYQSTIFMKDWISKMPIVQKLVVIFKYILSLRGYNSNFTGGIGSYCLFVMIAAYMKEFCHEEDPSLSKYFRDILEWYGEKFDNLNHIVMLKQEGHCFVDEHQMNGEYDDSKKSLLKLVDPITGRLMNSSCLEYNNIRIEFKRILGQLIVWQSKINQELKTNKLPPAELMKIIHSKKSVDKWLNKFQKQTEISLKNVIQKYIN